jgi:purine-nucleoside phosphorylase
MAVRDDEETAPPILRCKDHRAPSVFTPEALLRETRRQKGIEARSVPEICILDPDGDMVRYVLAANHGWRFPHWACYHTDLYGFDYAGLCYGVVGCAVGAAFAVLVAEELFASGCKLLLSVTSAGQIAPIRKPPYFVIIDRGLRDEGTSYHYLPPADYSPAEQRLVQLAEQALAAAHMSAQVGATWTTDAPFRETREATADALVARILAVEMEAAALYAFAVARQKQVLCLAHVTNQMGSVEGDFEKGDADGAEESLRVVSAIAGMWRERRVQILEARGHGRSTHLGP